MYQTSSNWQIAVTIMVLLVTPACGVFDSYCSLSVKFPLRDVTPSRCLYSGGIVTETNSKTLLTLRKLPGNNNLCYVSQRRLEIQYNYCVGVSLPEFCAFIYQSYSRDLYDVGNHLITAIR